MSDNSFESLGNRLEKLSFLMLHVQSWNVRNVTIIKSELAVPGPSKATWLSVGTHWKHSPYYRLLLNIIVLEPEIKISCH